MSSAFDSSPAGITTTAGSTCANILWSARNCLSVAILLFSKNGKWNSAHQKEIDIERVQEMPSFCNSWPTYCDQSSSDSDSL
jgi:hypothetical protein